MTVLYTPQQNGVAERKNGSLTESAKCMLLDANLPNRFWGETVLTAFYLQNRTPNRSVPKTPYELFTREKPDLSHIRIFVSKVFSYIPKQKRKKWDDKAKEGILVGYDGDVKGYRILNPETNKIWVSRSVRIIESNENSRDNYLCTEQKEDSKISTTDYIPKKEIENCISVDNITGLSSNNPVTQNVDEELSGEFQNYLSDNNEDSIYDDC